MRKVALIGGGAAAIAMLLFGLLYQRGRGAEVSREVPRDDPNNLHLPPGASEKNPISTVRVVRTRLAADLQLVGSVTYDQDRFALVGPLASGRVVRLRAGVGDEVKAGQVLAEVESAEIGQAQAAYLSSRARVAAAEANLRRERELAGQHISSEREREIAEAQAVSEGAELKAAAERLRALGLGDTELRRLGEAGGTGGRVPLRAPISGTVAARLVTLGQAVERATDAFKIVDLSRLWIMLDLYEKDLTRVYLGQEVELYAESRPKEMQRAHVSYITPLVDEKTRTAQVRIELDNPAGHLRPGQFMTARLIGDPKRQPEVLAVPRRAIQSIEGRSLAFVRVGSGFERRSIEVGFTGGDKVEVRRGLKEGEEVVVDGAFLLKSEALR